MNSKSNEYLSKVETIFSYRDAGLGYPNAPTKSGLLALAREGRDVWNAWREKWPDVSVDFSDVDFPKMPIQFEGFQFVAKTTNSVSDGVQVRADFSGAKFGPKTTFAGASFGNRANFHSAQFGDATSFKDAQFGEYANFTDSRFKSNAIFERTKFGAGATFDGAQFDDGPTFIGASFEYITNFIGARFQGSVLFTGAHFGGRANFSGAHFGDHARFVATQFGPAATFDGVLFGNDCSFLGAQFGSGVTFIGAEFGDKAVFDASDRMLAEGSWRTYCGEEAYGRLKKYAERFGLSSSVFQNVDFSGARFKGLVSFQNREFLGGTNFGRTKIFFVSTTQKPYSVPENQSACFEGVPDFHGCKLHQDTSFDGAEFLAPASLEVARAYRTLKLAMAQQQAIREEQRFFGLEMSAESALAKPARRVLFKLYEVLSDYGFSIVRPMVLWLSCLVVIGTAHGALAGPSALQAGIDWERTIQWAEYVWLNAVPLPGSDKLQSEIRAELFGMQGSVRNLAIAIEMLHKSLTLIAAFLVGLGLRNLFKMRG